MPPRGEAGATRRARGQRFSLKELRIAPELAEAPVLREELLDFSRKVSETGHVSYNAKVGKHDDEIIAVCLCLFMATTRSVMIQEPLGI
jgi:hypothetical protein